MPKTYFAVEANTAAESWRTIRSVRAEPPTAIAGVLVDAPRAETFHTALEQSQQQFEAASVIGYESRPLNLYYGLSQAARALAAASSTFSVRQPLACREWQIRGHGLKTTTEVQDPARFFELEVSVEKHSSTRGWTDMYSRLSAVLGSPLDFGHVTVGALVSQIPEFSIEFGSVGAELRELHLMPATTHPSDQREGFVDIDLQLQGLPDQGEVTAAEISGVLDRYPSLRAARPSLITGAVRRAGGPDRFRVSFPRSELRAEGPYSAYPAEAAIYRRHRLAMPSAGVSRDALAPLALWALLLYQLSMVARYAPDSWTRLLSLRSSPVASKIEHLLDSALDAVPDLLAEALERIV